MNPIRNSQTCFRFILNAVLRDCVLRAFSSLQAYLPCHGNQPNSNSSHNPSNIFRRLQIM